MGGGVGRGEKQEVEGTILASKNMFSGVEKLLLGYFQLNVCFILLVMKKLVVLFFYAFSKFLILDF